MSNAIIIAPKEVEQKFRQDVARLNYQAILQSVHDIQFTRENVHEDLLIPANALVKSLADKKLEAKRPYSDVVSRIDEVFNSLHKPLLDAIIEKAAERKRLVQQVNAENAQIEAEKQRKLAIQTKIKDYIQAWSDIASNSTSTELLNKVESKINLAKGRPLEFKELHDEFVSKCDELLPIIKKRKELVAKLNDISEAQKEAEAENDVEKHVEALKKKNEINQQLRQSTEEVLETTFASLTFDDTVIGESVTPSIKPSRKTWKWRVDDMKLLHRKRPELTEIVPNESAIKELLNQEKVAKHNKNKTQIVIDGLVFFIEESYK